MIGILISLFNNILAIFKSVTGTYVMFGIFMASVVYILLVKEKREAWILSVMAIAVMFLFFNPAVFWLLGKKLLGDQTYCRMLWTIPQVMTTAYAMTDICERFDGKKFRQAGVVVLCVCTLMVSGHMIYTRDNFEKRENAYGFSDEFIETVNAIELSEDPSIKTRVSAEFDLVGKIRQIRTDIYPRHDREGRSAGGGMPTMCDEMLQEKWDLENLVTGARTGHSYLLLYTEHDSPEFAERGCKLAHKTEHYVLYCLDEVPRND